MTKIAFFTLVTLASSPAFAGSDHYGTVVESGSSLTDLTVTGSINRHDESKIKVLPKASGGAEADQSWPDFNRGPWGN
ncbi:hypothetical protein [Mesorhizobium abyssinicae]|uniref:hypothetical protein n=1 Tax=Mesorhizobium abyssinicae TaxID=1209958 RepID=UPI0033949484